MLRQCHSKSALYFSLKNGPSRLWLFLFCYSANGAYTHHWNANCVRQTCNARSIDPGLRARKGKEKPSCQVARLWVPCLVLWFSCWWCAQQRGDKSNGFGCLGCTGPLTSPGTVVLRCAVSRQRWRAGGRRCAWGRVGTRARQ